MQPACRTCFNPHPARRPGATQRQAVSILTRPEGRVQPALLSAMVKVYTRFQSSPGQKAGCNASMFSVLGSEWLFQSSPGQKAGCNRESALTSLRSRSGFQSSPGQKAGCNIRGRERVPLGPQFQSSPGQKAGCNAARFAISVVLIPFQSSPGQKAGCNVNIGNRSVRANPMVSILTRPEGRVQRGCKIITTPPTAVSILTRPEGRVQLLRGRG